MAADTDQKIRNYLNGMMDKPTALRFREELAVNSALRARVEELKYDVLETELSELKEGRNTLRTILAEKENEPSVGPKAKTGGKDRLWIAGLIVALAVAALMFWLLNPQTTKLPEQPSPELSKPVPTATPRDTLEKLPQTPLPPKESERFESEIPIAGKSGRMVKDKKVRPSARQLAINTHELPEGWGRVARNQAVVEDEFRAAYAALLEENYDRALALLQRIPDTSAVAYLADTYAGHVKFRQGDFRGSGATFLRVLDLPGVYRDDLEWALLLAWLAEDEQLTGRSDSLARAIMAEGRYHRYLEEASSLLAKLEKR